MSDKTNHTSAPNSTKELLDELDALMERMLSLPVDDPLGTSENPVATTATVADAADENLATDRENEHEDYPTDQKQTAEDTNYYYDQAESNASPDQDSEDIEGPNPMTVESLSSLTAEQDQDLPPSLASRSQLLAGKSRRRWWLAPFAMANRIFDAATHALGPVGQWLREPGGRMFLGLLGLVLLLGAIGAQVLLWLSWNK